MSDNTPAYRIVEGPFDPETKKWKEEYGALWERREGKPGYSGKITKPIPDNTSVLVIPTRPASGNGVKETKKHER